MDTENYKIKNRLAVQDAENPRALVEASEWNLTINRPTLETVTGGGVVQ
jgi:hypothetical protein